MSEIKALILTFPHGASQRDCDHIARMVQGIVKAGVSEGGMQCISKYGMYVDDMKFSEDTMEYTYGHKRGEDGTKS